MLVNVKQIVMYDNIFLLNDVSLKLLGIWDNYIYNISLLETAGCTNIGYLILYFLHSSD